eukprot:NODE_5_length_72347_cov_1.339331.p39 type:complete len:237 gc:universal NODE_5_length_72347_cov_1.339331:17320-18030(+)
MKNIVPNPGFVIKTKKMNTLLSGSEENKDLGVFKGKVFINVCNHESIDKPNTSSEQVIFNAIKKQDPFKIPMSLSPIRKGKDKQGIGCYVVDIMVHPNVFEWATKKIFASFDPADFKQLLKDIFLIFVRDRLQLDLEFVSFPNLLVSNPPLAPHEIIESSNLIDVLDVPLSVMEYQKGDLFVHQYSPVDKSVKILKSDNQIKIAFNGNEYYIDIEKNLKVNCKLYLNDEMLRIYIK